VLLAQAGHAGFIRTPVTDEPEHPTWLALRAVERGRVERIPQTRTRGLDTDIL
jgi:hypothetical protein